MNCCGPDSVSLWISGVDLGSDTHMDKDLSVNTRGRLELQRASATKDKALIALRSRRDERVVEFVSLKQPVSYTPTLEKAGI